MKASELKVRPKGEPVRLIDCPPGLFLFNGSLGFKSEYYTRDVAKMEVFVVASGEWFWGGVDGYNDRAQLIVQPLELLESEPRSATPYAVRQADANYVLRWCYQSHKVSANIRDLAARALGEPPLAHGCAEDMVPPAATQEQPLQVREGGWYRRRDGEVVGPAKHHVYAGTWSIKGPESYAILYTDGRWGGERDHDLLAEIMPPHGFKIVGYRIAEAGEFILMDNGGFRCITYRSDDREIILASSVPPPEYATKRSHPDACPTTGVVGCSMCSGEYCNTHFDRPCDCDTAERHTVSPPEQPGEAKDEYESSLPEEFLNAPVAFGLRAQKKLPTVRDLLAKGRSWDEIGAAIGWHPATAKEHYEKYCKAQPPEPATAPLMIEPDRAEVQPEPETAIQRVVRERLASDDEIDRLFIDELAKLDAWQERIYDHINGLPTPGEKACRECLREARGINRMLSLVVEAFAEFHTPCGVKESEAK